MEPLSYQEILTFLDPRGRTEGVSEVVVACSSDVMYC